MSKIEGRTVSSSSALRNVNPQSREIIQVPIREAAALDLVPAVESFRQAQVEGKVVRHVE